MARTEQEFTAIAKAYFEYAAWFVAVGHLEFEKWKAHARQVRKDAEEAAIARGENADEIREAKTNALDSLAPDPDHPQEWAAEEVRNIIDGAAGDAWQLVLKLVELVPDDKEVRSFLAAGPVEDFLGSHGDRYIAEVVRLAADLPRFKDLLGGVLQNAMSDELWGKVQSIRAGPS